MDQTLIPLSLGGKDCVKTAWAAGIENPIILRTFAVCAKVTLGTGSNFINS